MTPQRLAEAATASRRSPVHTEHTSPGIHALVYPCLRGLLRRRSVVPVEGGESETTGAELRTAAEASDGEVPSQPRTDACHARRHRPPVRRYLGHLEQPRPRPSAICGS